jgi:hypothetical protein
VATRVFLFEKITQYKRRNFQLLDTLSSFTKAPRTATVNVLQITNSLSTTLHKLFGKTRSFANHKFSARQSHKSAAEKEEERV